MKLLTILVCIMGLNAGKIDFTFKIIYLKQDKELVMKLDYFSENLEKQLDNYNWKVPHEDFYKIETSIDINIDQVSTDKSCTGVITVSSGLVTDSKPEVALKKDIYFNEMNLTFTVDYEIDPQLDKMDPASLETLVMFYSNLALGECFDRLSYTDQKNYKLEGDHYFQKMYEFENILTNAAERKNWNKRLELIETYRLNKNIELRKLNALIYNSVYFINAGKKDRAKLFIEPIYEIISKLFDIPGLFFLNNYYALGEIFALSKDEKHIKLLIEKDPSHEGFYTQRLPKQNKPDRQKQ